jgi:hypothetical protein
VRALGAGDDQRAFALEAVEMGEGMDEMPLVVTPDAVGVVVGCRRGGGLFAHHGVSIP